MLSIDIFSPQFRPTSDLATIVQQTVWMLLHTEEPEGYPLDRTILDAVTDVWAARTASRIAGAIEDLDIVASAEVSVTTIGEGPGVRLKLAVDVTPVDSDEVVALSLSISDTTIDVLLRDS